MKKIITMLFLVLFCVQGVAAAGMTDAELKKTLTYDSELNTIKNQFNSFLGQLPGLIKGVVAKDGTYHVRVSGYNVMVVLKSGEITSIWRGKPDNPDYVADAKYETVLKIANGDNPLGATTQALISGDIRVAKAAKCDEDIECADNQVCDDGQCRDAFTIAVVPIGYSSGEYNDFYEKAKSEMDLFDQFAPVDYVRVHYVNPSVCPNYECTEVCVDCQNTVRDCAQKAGLVGVADKVAGVSKGDVQMHIGGGQYMLLCGCAGGIPTYTSLSRSRLYVEGGVYCYNTVPHEMGHQLGLYHIDATGEEAGACQGPNAVDCKEANKKADIMGYAWPQDHFGPAATSYLINDPFKGYQG